MIRVVWLFTVMALCFAGLVQVAAITAPTNVYDRLPIKCGYKLRDTCPSSGVNWVRK
jgi:hypothetical protein